MTTTFADLISDVESDLYSYTQVSDQATWLTAPIAPTDLTIAVQDASLFSSGFAEITSSAGNEVIAVAGRDETANTITLPPWGRAQRNTTALAHPINSRIVAAPQFPRSRISQLVNEALSDTYPTLFRVSFQDIALQTGVAIYPLPSDSEGLVDVQVQHDDNPESGWQQLRRMRFVQSDHTLDIANAGRDGYTMRVTYRCPPKSFVSLTDTLDSVGYGDQMRSVVRLGTIYKALTGLQAQRLQVATVESAANVQLRQPDFLGNAIKTVLAQYQIALQAQSDRLRDLYPPLRYRLP